MTRKFNLLPTEKKLILNILRDIDITKATGIDWYPRRFLKDGTDVLAKSVTDICNLSLSFNEFPSAFKLSQVKPIFKEERKTNVSYYRPISLLPILLKVIKKVFHEQTTKFLNDYKIYYKDQPGFRSNHLTDLFPSFVNS